MLFQESEIKEREDNFYKNIIRLYLKYGSVDEVFKVTNYDLPISYPGMHHLIKRWGVVKSVGPNSTLSEALTFLTLMTENKIPLETMYKKLPSTFKTSMSTMHRILHLVKEGVVRRYGTALIISLRDNREKVLVGKDLSHHALTLPMTYSSPKDTNNLSVLRVLQQEVFTELAVEKYNLAKLIPGGIKPFMHLTIADIKVSVYSIELDPNFLSEHQFSSSKISNIDFSSIYNIQNTIFSAIRPGVKDILSGYQKYLAGNYVNLDQISNLNLALLQT